MTSTETVKFIVAMTIMMNPLGSLSIFLDLTRKAEISEQRKIALTVSFAIFTIMLLTVWTGKDLLNILGITIPSFRVAGGLILLLMGLSMLQSKESPLSHTSEDNIAARERHSIAVVPMALPVIIGPGAISTIIIEVGDAPQFISKLWFSAVCAILTIIMGIMLYFAAPIARIVGASVMKVITRIMGMIIMAIAVGMLANGLIELFPAFK
jgi:multiple antibiotic resistance protein